MTKAQIRYLKILGFEETQEDGAILQASEIGCPINYVWEGDSFESVLVKYQESTSKAIREICQIRRCTSRFFDHQKRNKNT